MREGVLLVAILVSTSGMAPLRAQRTPVPVQDLDWPNIPATSLEVVQAFDRCISDEEFEAWSGSLTGFADDESPILEGEALCDVLDRKGPFSGLSVMFVSEHPDGALEFAVCYPKHRVHGSLCPVFRQVAGVWRVARLQNGVIIGAHDLSADRETAVVTQ